LKAERTGQPDCLLGGKARLKAERTGQPDCLLGGKAILKAKRTGQPDCLLGGKAILKAKRTGQPNCLPEQWTSENICCSICSIGIKQSFAKYLKCRAKYLH
jgi:hypothetical protein